MGVIDEPFVGSWALAAGALTRHQLRHDFERVVPDVYSRKGRPLDAIGRAKAAVHWTCRLPRDQAIPALDALCRATGLDPSTALAFADVHQRVRGCARARAVLGLVDPGAESPPESLTRLLLIDYWSIIRVSADLLRNRPYIVIDRVVAALNARGAQLDDGSPGHHGTIARERKSLRAW
ncbi:hypothetical protein [Nocardia sp. A7]|uniref:hypothetical protein n=1 Tax=Nocardia sp. A7 TaxID=2789274 RepID=UPI00397ACDB4